MIVTYLAVAFVFTYLFSRSLVGQDNATDNELFWAVFVPILLGFALDNLILFIKVVMYFWNL